MKNSRMLAAEICHTFRLCQSCRGGDWWLKLQRYVCSLIISFNSWAPFYVNIKPFFHLAIQWFRLAGDSCPLSLKLSSTSARWSKGFFSVMQPWLVEGLLGCGQRFFTNVLVNEHLADPWDDVAQVDHERLPEPNEQFWIAWFLRMLFQEWETSHGSCFDLALQGRLFTVSTQQTTTCSTLLG